MKPITLRSLTLLLFVVCQSVYGQFTPVEQITYFTSRVQMPIKIDVEQNKNEFIFYGTNNSFLPYRVEIEFKQLLNLEPAMNSHKAVLQPGRTRLFALRIRQENSASNFRYDFRYRMGNPSETPDLEFPYLVPLAKNKKVSVNSVTSIATIAPVLFNIAAGDTIFAMRKGRVTAAPESSSGTDRLTKASLEVYHADGSLASYYALDLRGLVKEGTMVYPGQPIGIVEAESVLRVLVFKFTENEQVRPISVKYVADGSSLIPAGNIDQIVSIRPAEVITKELTRSEIKKFQKDILY